MPIRPETTEALAPPRMADDAPSSSRKHSPSREWRFGFNAGGSRFYLNVRLGIERRTLSRLTHDGQRHLPLGAIASTLAGGAFFVAFGLICFLYLVKSLLGIDLFAGNSPLHALFVALTE